MSEQRLSGKRFEAMTRAEWEAIIRNTAPPLPTMIPQDIIDAIRCLNRKRLRGAHRRYMPTPCGMIPRKGNKTVSKKAPKAPKAAKPKANKKKAKAKK